MIKYKMTDINSRTRPYCPNECHWAPGMVREAAGRGGELCTDAFIHWYDSPEIAVLMYPIHVRFHSLRLWEIEASGRIKMDGQAKGGSKRVRIIKELPLPAIQPKQRAEIAIRCAMACCDLLWVFDGNKNRASSFRGVWKTWATRWLDGTDRTQDSINGLFQVYLQSDVYQFVRHDEVFSSLTAAIAATEDLQDRWKTTRVAAVAAIGAHIALRDANQPTLDLQGIIDSVLE